MAEEEVATGPLLEDMDNTLPLNPVTAAEATPAALPSTNMQYDNVKNISIFCVKCRKKQIPTKVITAEIHFTRKNQNVPGVRYCLEALCPVCQIRMMRFVKKDEVDKMKADWQLVDDSKEKKSD